MSLSLSLLQSFESSSSEGELLRTFSSHEEEVFALTVTQRTIKPILISAGMDRSIKCWRLPLTLFISLSSSGRDGSSPPLEDEETHGEGEGNDEEITKDNFRMLSWDLNQQEIDDEEEQEIEARIRRQQLIKKSHGQQQLQQGSSNENRKNLVVGEYIEEEEEEWME